MNTANAIPPLITGNASTSTPLSHRKGIARQSRNGAGRTDRKMGSLFIFLSPIFLSVVDPASFLAACNDVQGFRLRADITTPKSLRMAKQVLLIDCWLLGRDSVHKQATRFD
jgi:hypothetical protein